MEREVLHLLPLCLPPAELQELRTVLSSELRRAVQRASVRDVATLCSLSIGGLDGQDECKGRSALMVAIILAGNSRSRPRTHAAYLTIIRILIAAGANVHLLAYFHGWNALDYASEQGLDSICLLLEAKGARMTSCGQRYFGVRATAPT